MQSAIVVENVGKKYRLARSGDERLPYRTLRDELARWASWPVRYLRGQTARVEDFWALKDVSFEVQPGEVVGVIGRNGAGKSTLLKVLSRITKPTKGRVRMRGRVGSLLEVGTGFHPELTGRENIYLSGAVLGMRRVEIRRKFDEIVAFAEVEKFLDLPVKRYSSGMYMRLAFAVAAHLEPEILLVDEVLAVGDAAFQKKCLGKMGDIAKCGRTVLFVSHVLQSIGELTRQCILLRRGEVAVVGPTRQVLATYHRSTDLGLNSTEKFDYEATPGKSQNHVQRCQVKTSEAHCVHSCGQSLEVVFDISINDPHQGLCFSFQIIDEMGRACSHFWMFDDGEYRRKQGVYKFRCIVPSLRLYMGTYTLKTWLSDRRADQVLEQLSSICPFEVTMDKLSRPAYTWRPGEMTYLEDAEWQIEQLS
jgi:lipopolysaccharide transport system ATP-binding protein